mgnify:FL=1
MIYTRGNKEDFDEWARDGNEGWGYKDVWPYFVKSEKSRIPHFRHSVSHGQEGPVTVDFLPYQTKLIDAFLQAGQEMGKKKKTTYVHDDFFIIIKLEIKQDISH